MELPDSDIDHSALFDESLIDNYVRDRLFIDRNWLSRMVAEKLDDPECRVVLITGDPGSGKTTLMAWLAHQHPDWLRYFIRRAGEAEAGDAHRHEGALASFLTVAGLQLATSRPELFPDLAQLLRLEGHIDVDELVASGRAVGVLIDEWVTHPFRKLAAKVTMKVRLVEGELLGIHIGKLVDAGADPHQYLEEPALFEPARRLARLHPDQRIVILLDGLDELRFRVAAVDVGQWLTDSAELPRNVRIIVTSRGDDARLTEFRSGPVKAWLKTIHIDPSRGEVQRDVKLYAAGIAADPQVGRVLAAHDVPSERFVQVAVAKAAGNFQYLAFLARVVEGESTDPADVTATDEDWLGGIEALPAQLSGLYAQFLTRVRNRVSRGAWRGSPWERVFLPLLGILAVARAPLTVGQLSLFAGVEGGERAAHDALTAIRQFLNRDRSGGYRLFHSSVSDFLDRDRTDRAEPHPGLHVRPLEWHERIARHALVCHAHDSSWQSADSYLRVHLAGHAAESGLLDDLLEDPGYLLVADPTGLTEMFGAATRSAPITRFYRQVLPMLLADDASGTLSHLQLFAHQAGVIGFARRTAALPAARSWALSWTHWSQMAVRQIIRSDDRIHAVVTTRLLDGTPIAVSGGQNGVAKIWDLRNGQPLGQLKHSHPEDRFQMITALAVGKLNSGERLLLSGGTDGTIRAWNLETHAPAGPHIASMRSAGGALAVGAVDAGTAAAAVCSRPDVVRAWNLFTRKPVGPPVPALNAEQAALCEHDGRVLMAVAENPGPDDAYVRVWNARSGMQLGPTLRVTEGWVSGVAIGSAGGTAVVAVADGARGVQAFEAETGRPLSPRLMFWEARPRALCVGELDGRSVMAIGDEQGDLWLWDLAAREYAVRAVALHPGGEVSSLAIASTLTSSGTERGAAAPGEEELARLSSLDPAVRLAAEEELLTMSTVVREWTPELRPVGQPYLLDRGARSMAVVHGLARALVVADSGHRAQVRFPPGGPTAVYFNGNDLADMQTRRSISATTTGGLSIVSGADDKVRALAVARVHGRPVAIACVGEITQVWDIETGDEVRELDLGRPTPHDIAVATREDRPIVLSDSGHAADLATGGALERLGIRLSRTPARAFATGRLGEREVAVLADEYDTHIVDLATGEPMPTRHQAHRYAHSLAVAHDHVVGATTHTLLAWHRETEDVVEVEVSDHVATFALAELDGRLVAVCGGQSGELRLVDVVSDTRQAVPGSHTPSLAVSVLEGSPVVVYCCDAGIRVIDLNHGGLASPSPDIGGSKPHLVAVGEWDDRPIGACATYKAVHLWDLLTGAPVGASAIECAGEITCLAFGTFEGSAVAIVGVDGGALRLFDLISGQEVCRPRLPERIKKVTGAGMAEPGVLVYNTSLTLRGVLLDSADTDPRLLAGEANPLDFDARDDTPVAPPRLGPRFDDRLHHHHGGTDPCMALGVIAGAPVVVSGHEDGSVDVFTVETALPVSTLSHEAPVSAVAFGTVHGRPIVASGGKWGVVRIWDLAAGVPLAVIHTYAYVHALALASPDHCVIGTDRGVITVRVAAPDSPAGAIDIPTDPRSSRRCPHHDEHVERGRTASGYQASTMLRICVKGIQQGNPKTRPLDFVHGHCAVLPDRLVIAESGEIGWENGMTVLFDEIMIEPEDTPWAYDYDGGHFAVRVHRPSDMFTLCCYRRSDRDLLSALIKHHQDPHRPTNEDPLDLGRWQPPQLKGWRFHPPPKWPRPPNHWTPQLGWEPDPDWPPPPPDWPFWVEIISPVHWMVMAGLALTGGGGAALLLSGQPGLMALGVLLVFLTARAAWLSRGGTRFLGLDERGQRRFVALVTAPGALLLGGLAVIAAVGRIPLALIRVLRLRRQLRRRIRLRA